MDIVERFLKYTSFETTSDDSSETVPSTKIQLELGKYLVEELKGLGLDNARIDDKGYVYAHLESNTDKDLAKIGFVAHMDTSPEMSGKNVKPRIVKYEGGDIKLNEKYTT